MLVEFIYLNWFYLYNFQEMDQLLNKEAASELHENADAFFCIILSHGKFEGVCGTDGNTIPIERITEKFDAKNCPNLRHKPKIFIIQSCKGGGWFEIKKNRKKNNKYSE